ncbi:MAG: hypothetical protein J7L94_13295 [Caldisericaceae bacterium]|nr:hypothetical protein [Caldisericaceae bacterium]
MQEVINTTINNNDWTEIKLESNRHCRSYGFQSRSGADFMVKATAESNNYFSVLNGKSIAISEYFIGKGTLFYAKAINVSSDVIETIITA